MRVVKKNITFLPFLVQQIEQPRNEGADVCRDLKFSEPVTINVDNLECNVQRSIHNDADTAYGAGHK